MIHTTDPHSKEGKSETSGARRAWRAELTSGAQRNEQASLRAAFRKRVCKEAFKIPIYLPLKSSFRFFDNALPSPLSGAFPPMRASVSQKSARGCDHAFRNHRI